MQILRCTIIGLNNEGFNKDDTSIQWRVQGVLLACPPPPPIGPNSFTFTYVSTEKHPCRRPAPPDGSAPPPQRELLDPQLVLNHNLFIGQKPRAGRCCNIMHGYLWNGLFLIFAKHNRNSCTLFLNLHDVSCFHVVLNWESLYLCPF